MPKKYVPSYKEFIIPFTYLILGTASILVSLNIYNKIIQGGLLILGIIFAMWGAARIMRIFLKVFLQEIRRW